MPEEIVFNGITFRRYPKSKRRNDRVYFKPHAGYIKKGIMYLHQEIWKSVNGNIPEGCCIHHIDGDPLNNAIENLSCIPITKHSGDHSTEWHGEHQEQTKNHMDEIRPLTKAWHASGEGREWHALHAANWKRADPIDKVCESCGATFKDKTAGHTGRFCSNNCKSAYRRYQHFDEVRRICPVCSKAYNTNKYRQNETCSKSCAGRLRWQNRNI
jgi:YHS domain-containing protein